MPVTVQCFKGWLKSSNNMKLRSGASVLRLTYEHVTKFASLHDLDNKSIQNFPIICKKITPAIEAEATNIMSVESSTTGAKIFSISVNRIITSFNVAKHHVHIARKLNAQKMGYASVLDTFKIENEDHLSVKDDDASKAPKMNDRDNDRKTTRWAPVFNSCLSNSYVSRGQLICVVRDVPTVHNEVVDPLLTNYYYKEIGSFISELESCLSHSRHVLKNDITTVCMKIEETARSTSVESSIKYFYRHKDRRGAFKALTSDHAGEVKHRKIIKKRLNLLQNIKWNGQSYLL